MASIIKFVDSRISNMLVIPSLSTSESVESISKDLYSHWDLVTSANPATQIRPILMIRTITMPGTSRGSSDLNLLAHRRYDEIDHDLNGLSAVDKDDPNKIEDGAINTAKALINQMRNRQLAPPELSWMGNEAIIMLWALGKSTIALTVTDGEFGYTVRQDRKTIDRKSNFKPGDFELLRLK